MFPVARLPMVNNDNALAFAVGLLVRMRLRFHQTDQLLANVTEDLSR